MEALLNFNKFRKLKIDLFPKIKRKVKYIYDYKNIVKDGTVKFMYRRVQLTDDLSNFPFKLSDFAKIVGFTPDYVGQREGNFLLRSKTNLETMKKFITKPKYKAIYKIFIEELSKPREVITSGFNTGIYQLKNYFEPSFSMQTIEQTVKTCSNSEWQWFRIPELVEPEEGDILRLVNFNPLASPGHYSKKLVAKERKGSVPITHQVAEDLYNFMNKHVLKNYYLWELLGKQKDVKLEEGTEVTSRVIMNTEEPMVLLLSLFSQPLTKVISNDKLNRIFIAKDQTAEIARDIQNKRNKYDFTLESDWTLFDSNIAKDDIIVASSILLSNIDQSSGRMRRAVYLIISSIVTKYIALSPGVVVRIDKGVPSGHPFTSLITSIVNIIYWCRIGEAIYGKNYAMWMDIVVQGDDANVFFTDHPNLDKIDDIISSLGIKSDKLHGKFIYNKMNNDIHDQPIFLKRKHVNDNLIWDRKAIVRRICYQWSKSKGHEQDIDILRNYILTAPDDELMNDLLFEMIEFKLNLIGKDCIYVEQYMKELMAFRSDKSKQNVSEVSLFERFNFFETVRNKHIHVSRMINVKRVLLEKKAYLFSLMNAFPPGSLQTLEKGYLNEIVNARDREYIVDSIITGFPIIESMKGLSEDSILLKD